MKTYSIILFLIIILNETVLQERLLILLTIFLYKLMIRKRDEAYLHGKKFVQAFIQKPFYKKTLLKLYDPSTSQNKE